eukprot:1498175-Prymnesium_polylepis.1
MQRRPHAMPCVYARMRGPPAPHEEKKIQQRQRFHPATRESDYTTQAVSSRGHGKILQIDDNDRDVVPVAALFRAPRQRSLCGNMAVVVRSANGNASNA